MSWQGALILVCMFMAVFALGCWYGQRERRTERRGEWLCERHAREFDQRNRQRAWERIWRTR